MITPGQMHKWHGNTSSRTPTEARASCWLRRVVRAVVSLWPIIPLALVLTGFGMMALAKYKIRSICEKYPVEIQMRDFPACVNYGGPWPQKTNAINAKP